MLMHHDFFISHNSKDSDKARELKKVLLQINSSFDIFLDCDITRPLETSEEWKEAMLEHLSNSRYLIFLATSPEYLKKGNGWLFEEVNFFYDSSVNHRSESRHDYTLGYFGIIFGKINFSEDLFNDPHRGKIYRLIYNHKQHILLDSEDTIAGACNRIEAKVRNMTSTESDRSSEMMDKVNAYTIKRQQQDEMFSPKAIDKLLLPDLYAAVETTAAHSRCNTKVPFSKPRSGNHSACTIGFDELCHTLTHTHAVVLGEQGGCGKTTLMTRLFFHFHDAAKVDDPNTMIPLFVDARSLTGDDNLILRHLAETLYHEYTAKVSQYATDSVSKLSHEFALARPQPRYLLLIDGCNELPEKSIKIFSRELKEFSPDGKYPNVRLVLSGRTAAHFNLPDDHYFQVTIGKLSRRQVFLYLEHNQDRSEHIKRYLREVRKNGIIKTRGNRTIQDIETVMEILQTPLFSKIFVESNDSNLIDTKGELMRQFILHQDRQFRNSDAAEEVKSFNHLCLNHILPLISYTISTNTKGSQYSFTENQLHQMLSHAITLMSSMEYRSYYGKEYREHLTAGITDTDVLNIADQFIDHMLKHSKLLRQSADRTFELIHQVYRDFFAAYYIAEDIKRALDEGTMCNALCGELLNPDLLSFVTELLKEVYVPFDWETKDTAYCDSILNQMLEIARRNSGAQSACYVANVVALLRTVRRNDLSGIDFSDLDLTQSNLRTCMLARQSDTEIFAANFRGATINVENLLKMNHHSPIIAACAGKRFIATCDSMGTIMLWDRKQDTRIPVKIIEEAAHNLSKIIFSPDERYLYGMSDKYILQLQIPAAFRSYASCKTLLESPKRILDIKLDKFGKLQFSTFLNPANYKPISKPDQPDQVELKTVASCAAISADSTHMVVCFTPYTKGLQLYCRNRITDTWTNVTFGYKSPMDTYFQELQNALKSFGVYGRLNCVKSPNVTSAKQLFDQLRERPEIKNTCTNKSLSFVLSYINRKLDEAGVSLADNQRQQLDQIYKDTLAQLKANSRMLHILQNISQYQIRSVSWHPRLNTLLLAYSSPVHTSPSPVPADAVETPWYNTVVEMDPATLQMRLISEFTSKRSVHFTAHYSADCIIVVQQGGVEIYDHNGELNNRIRYIQSRISSFVFLGKNDDVCAVSRDNIYRLDHDNVCVAAWHNDLDDSKLLYCEDADGERYLVGKKRFELAVRPARTKVLKLQTGEFRSKSRNALEAFHSFNFSNRNPDLPANAICQRHRAYQYNNGKLLCYNNDVKISEIDVYYKLFICGCDFQEIQGTLSNPEHLRLLHQYGALTDWFPKSDETILPKITPSTPSQTPLVFDTSCHRYQPIKKIRCDHLTNFHWDKIQNLLSDSAYAILEWIDLLGIATPEIISQLMTADVQCKLWNTTTSHDVVEKDLRFLTDQKLIWCPVKYSKRVSDEKQLLSLTKLGGQALLRRSTAAVPLNHDNIPVGEEDEKKAIRDLLKKASTNNWFGTVAQKYARHITNFALYKTFDSSLRSSARGRINGYLKLGEQAFFAEPILDIQSNEDANDLRNKVKRMCAIAECYTQLVRFDFNARYQESFTHQPVLIFIAKDLNMCRKIHRITKDICPDIRKLYTCHELLKTDYNGPIHFELVSNLPYSVELDDLILDRPVVGNNTEDTSCLS